MPPTKALPGGPIVGPKDLPGRGSQPENLLWFNRLARKVAGAAHRQGGRLNARLDVPATGKVYQEQIRGEHCFEGRGDFPPNPAFQTDILPFIARPGFTRQGPGRLPARYAYLESPPSNHARI